MQLFRSRTRRGKGEPREDWCPHPGCVARIGENYHEVVTYQPGDRYWTFQWWELALFALVTALLCGYAGYRLRRFRG